MSNDWIKMRVNLVTHPKVMAIAEFLADQSEYQEWSTLTGFVPNYGGVNERTQRNERYAALRVTRYVTVCALLRFWGYANEHARDEFVALMTIKDIDEIVQVPSFGLSLQSVGWIECSEEPTGIRLPNFAEFNAVADERQSGAKAAKRQKRYRERLKSSQRDVMGDVTGALPRDVTGDVTVTQRYAPREEKTRLDVNHHHPAVGGIVGSDSILEENQIETAATKTTRAKRMNGTKVSLPVDTLECPTQAIIDAYHASMPDNPACKVLNAARRKSIASRWREASRLTCKPFDCYQTKEQGITAWNKFFSVCATSEFLTGRAPPQPGRPSFIANIDFLVSPDGFAKCLENRYHDRGGV